MCAYCEWGKDIGGDDSSIAIEHGNLLTFNTSEYGHDERQVEINYCPMCGRKLTEDKE